MTVREQPVGVDLGSGETASAALRTFFAIASAWGLTREEQQTVLGVPDDGTLERGLNDEIDVLTPDMLARLSCIFGIYKALQILLPDTRAADEWLRKPNSAPLFQGRPALDRLLSGDAKDLEQTRNYLEAQLQGWA